MSKFAIDDLFVAQESLRDLNKEELKLSGGAVAGASAGADYNDAVAASGSTTRGDVYAYADGSYYSSYYDRYRYPDGTTYTYSGYYSGGPSASVSAYSWY